MKKKDGATQPSYFSAQNTEHHGYVFAETARRTVFACTLCKLTQSAFIFYLLTDFYYYLSEQGCINGTDIKENNSFTQGYFHQI